MGSPNSGKLHAIARVATMGRKDFVLPQKPNLAKSVTHVVTKQLPANGNAHAPSDVRVAI